MIGQKYCQKKKGVSQLSKISTNRPMIGNLVEMLMDKLVPESTTSLSAGSTFAVCCQSVSQSAVQVDHQNRNSNLA